MTDALDELVSCPYGCGARIERRWFQNHLRNCSPRRAPAPPVDEEWDGDRRPSGVRNYHNRLAAEEQRRRSYREAEQFEREVEMAGKVMENEGAPARGCPKCGKQVGGTMSNLVGAAKVTLNGKTTEIAGGVKYYVLHGSTTCEVSEDEYRVATARIGIR